MTVFRLIRDGARSADLNMAVDERLMLSQESGAYPTLRFYGWDKPSISVGYFQDTIAIAERFKKKYPVVRRLTGGGLVIHDGDLTFSLSLPNPNPFFPKDVKGAYLKINEALRIGLKELYPDLDYFPCKDEPSGRASDSRVCFEQPSCYDLLIKNKKVVGASQRRMGGAALHQSTIFLKGDARKLEDAIVRGFEKNWGVAFEEKPLSREEIADAEKTARERYSHAEWAAV